MANNYDQPGEYFFRSFSGTSAGSLISGKGRGDGCLSKSNLYHEFKNHIHHDHSDPRVPTALVSVSSRIIDTLRRAFNKLYKDNEPPEQIWIAVCFVPREDSNKNIYHHAKHLAEKLNLKDSSKFRYEYVFEWEISPKYLVHKVSVQTLMERGFNMEEYLLDREELPPTLILRNEVAKNILDPSKCGFDIGLNLGIFARCFGARSPLHHIAHQLLHDCSYVISVNFGAQIAYVSYWEQQSVCLDFEHFASIEMGIDTALMDWWLADTEFCLEYREHSDWALRIKEEMELQWELLRDAARDVDLDDHLDIERYNHHQQRLQAMEDQMDVGIEIAAVKLGL